MTNPTMHPDLMHDPWDDSTPTPTFRSVYHFSILPQSEVNQDYFRGRRPGDVTLASRQRQADDDYLKTQNRLARAQSIPPKEQNNARRRSQSRRRERTASDEERNSTQVPTSTTDSSLARRLILSDIDWHEVLVKLLLLIAALLISAFITLRPIAGRETGGSAARTYATKGLVYELVPDRRRWAVPQTVEQTGSASAPSLSSPAGLDSDGSSEQAIASTALGLAESIVPMIDFGKLLGLSPKSSDASATTISPVSTERAVNEAWEFLTESPAHSTSPVTIEETMERAPGSSDDPQTPFTVTIEETAERAPWSMDDPPTPSTVTIEETVERALSSLDDPQTPSFTVTIEETGPTPAPAIAPAEAPRAPPERPRSFSDGWHYCKRCSQWHG